MSNADRCGRQDCRMPRDSAAHGYGPGAHDFVEPAPAPSGDEAKVRDGDIVALMKELEPFCRGSVLAGLSRAYAAGKADGAREEREACEAIVMEKHCESDCLHPSCGHHRKLANRIARRGSEGT